MKHKKTATLLVIEGNPTYAHHWWSKNKHQLFYLPPHSFLYENAQNNGISQNIESFLLSGLPNSPQQSATNNTYDHGALVLNSIIGHKNGPIKTFDNVRIIYTHTPVPENNNRFPSDETDFVSFHKKALKANINIWKQRITLLENIAHSNLHVDAISISDKFEIVADRSAIINQILDYHAAGFAFTRSDKYPIQENDPHLEQLGEACRLEVITQINQNITLEDILKNDKFQEKLKELKIYLSKIKPTTAIGKQRHKLAQLYIQKISLSPQTGNLICLDEMHDTILEVLDLGKQLPSKMQSAIHALQRNKKCAFFCVDMYPFTGIGVHGLDTSDNQVYQLPEDPRMPFISPQTDTFIFPNASVAFPDSRISDTAITSEKERGGLSSLVPLVAAYYTLGKSLYPQLTLEQFKQKAKESGICCIDTTKNYGGYIIQEHPFRAHIFKSRPVRLPQKKSETKKHPTYDTAKQTTQRHIQVKFNQDEEDDNILESTVMENYFPHDNLSNYRDILDDDFSVCGTPEHPFYYEETGLFTPANLNKDTELKEELEILTTKIKHNKKKQLKNNQESHHLRKIKKSETNKKRIQIHKTTHPYRKRTENSNE